MSTQWPIVVSRLVALLPTLPGWSAVSVYDGQPLTSAPAGSLCTVGYIEDEDAGNYTDAASVIGNMFTTEAGEVRCRLVVSDGGSTMATVRASAFALADALRDHLRGDPLMGVLPQGSTTSLRVGIGSAQNGQGAGQRLDFILSYSCPVI